MFSNFNPNQNQNSQNNQSSFKEKVKLWWATVPFFVRFIMMSTISFYILSWFLGDFTKALTNVPAFVIYYIQLWRLITSPLVTLSIFNILFGFLAWIPDAIRLEYSTGTIKYMFAFFLNSFIIQILYVALSFLLSIISKQFILMPSSGLWPVIMAEITILCLTNPENQLRMMFLPCLIPAKYYPWGLFGFFSLMNMNFQFDIVAGIIYGYLFHYLLTPKVQLSDQYINRIENISLVNKLTNLTSFVSSSKAASVGENSFTASNTNQILGGNINKQNDNASSFNQQVPSKPSAPLSTPFQGTGSVLGSSGVYKDLKGMKAENTNLIKDSFNNLSENKFENLDEDHENPYKKIKFEEQKAADNVHSKLIENSRKEEVNDRYHKFQDRI